MRLVLATILIAIYLSGCSFRGASGSAASSTGTQRFSEDEKHKLYTAALAASDSPIDTDLFKEVCKTIGIFDADGKPNEKYMVFVAEHVQWAMTPETDKFRGEINTKDKAREYIHRQLER